MPTPNPPTILHRKRRRVWSLHGQVHQYCYEAGEVIPYDELSRSGAFSQRLMKQFADHPVQKSIEGSRQSRSCCSFPSISLESSRRPSQLLLWQPPPASRRRRWVRR